MSKLIVVAGSMAQKPFQGGHTWVFLQYLLGFRRLGLDVFLVDRVTGGTATDEYGNPCPPEESIGVQCVADVLKGFGLNDSFAILADDGHVVAGVDRSDVVDLVGSSALLMNVMGFLDDPRIRDRARRRLFLDIDPGFPQMWRALGLHDAFAGHDDFVTLGGNEGLPGCSIPTCGLSWLRTRPPVVLEHWASLSSSPDAAFTSVATWRGAYGPVVYEGTRYGLRAHEFRKFADVPRRCDGEFQLALDIHADDVRDADQLTAGGWSLRDPRDIARDPWAYRDFVRSSGAEFMVAKQMYVETRSGWFSDRSACYLASGRPVLMQDTGLESRYPVGKGLITFRTREEAIRGVEEIRADYEGHARAARRLAEEMFDSDIVLSELLSSLGIT